MNFMEDLVREAIKMGDITRAKTLVSIMEDKQLAARLEMECFTAGLWICSTHAAVEAQIEIAPTYLQDVMWSIYQKFVELFGAKEAV